MYTKYVTNATSVATEVVADLAAILTGTTDVNTLSASCNKALTEIHFSHDVAGWTMHDAAAGTGQIVIKSPVYDNVNQFKYARLNFNSGSYGGHWAIDTAEGWNSTTHAGTNVCPGSSAGSAYAYRYSTTTVTVFNIYANARCIVAASAYSGTYGNAWIPQTLTAVAEYTRWSPWNTSSAGYPNWISTYGFNAAYVASGRYKNASGVDTASGNMTAPKGLMGALSKIYDAAGNQAVPLCPLIWTAGSSGNFGGSVTEASGIYSCPNALTATPAGDEIDINGTTYILWSAVNLNNDYGIATKKG